MGRTGVNVVGDMSAAMIVSDYETRREAKEAAAAGFPLCYDKKKNLAYVDNGEAHSLVIGATGSGKTTMVINPLVNFLAKKGESMVITDPKGEIYEKNGEMLKDKGYEVIVVNFRDPKNGSCWNPYSLPYKYYKEGNTDKILPFVSFGAIIVLEALIAAALAGSLAAKYSLI
jgi:DNA helicase HerA-like ATPase